MKLQHYLGGLENVGPVSTEVRVFVEDWETRIFGIHSAMMALSSQIDLPDTSSKFNTIWTWADLRKGAEAMHPFEYFKYRYYEKWLGGISGYFVSNDYITEEELEALTEEYYKDPDKPLPTVDADEIDERVITYLVEGDSPKRDVPADYKYAAGDKVLIADPDSIEHSRVPGYMRGMTCEVEKVYEGAYVYLCEVEIDKIGPAMPCYTVGVSADEVWPDNVEPNVTVYADLYASYLEAPANT